MEVYKGRPADTTGRLEKEVKTYDLLDSLGIEYERVDHEAAFTVEACDEIDAAFAPSKICKNLFLCNNQKTNFYMLMMPGDKKFKTKEVSKQIGSSRLSFAPETFMEEFLDLTPGSVTVLGLANDKNHTVKLLVDEELLKDDYIICHPCINTSSVKIKRSDIFEKFLPSINYDYSVVTLGLEE